MFSLDNKFHEEEVKKIIVELKGQESAKFVLKNQLSYLEKNTLQNLRDYAD
jgi:hypothetical protein